MTIIENNGKKAMENKTAPKLPITVSFNANNPSPFSRNLWPVSPPSAWAESGAPRNIIGIASRNVWVTDIDIINIARLNGDVYLRRMADDATTVADIRLIWIPGVRPVMIPARIPEVIKSSISMNIIICI